MPKVIKTVKPKAPLETVANGDKRDNKGRFCKGNKAATGNGQSRRMTQFRQQLFDAISEKDFRAIVKKVVEMAKEGSSWAVKMVVEYLCGVPHDLELEKRVDEMEEKLREAERQNLYEQKPTQKIP